MKKEKEVDELINANKELALYNEEKEKRAAELFILNSELIKKEAYLEEYIQGLEEMIFMTSHRLRQPVTNIIGLSKLLDQVTGYPEKLQQLLDHIRQSAILLDDFTKELTTFMNDLGHKGKKNV